MVVGYLVWSNVLWSPKTGSCATQSTPGDATLNLAEAGRTLSDADAQLLEKRLAGSPADINARAQLIGYYLYKEIGSAGTNPATILMPNPSRQARSRHLIWLIDHDPAIRLLCSPTFSRIDRFLDPTTYATAQAAWQRQVEGHAKDGRVLGNAGIFFAGALDSRAEDLFRGAEALDPSEPEWPDQLAQLESRKLQGLAGAVSGSQQVASAALADMEKAYALSDRSSQDVRLDFLAKTAYLAGDDVKAANYANRLLQAFPPGKGNANAWNIGNAIHDGNMVLGRVAARKGRVDVASQYLLKAGASPGSPQLNSFGPNMSLASDLLALGARATVLSYFDEVAKFWHDARLTTWRSAVSAGKAPNFGGNLWY